MKEHLGSLNDFLDFVSDTSCSTLYRGHCSAKYPLIPSIGRPHTRYAPNSDIEMDLFSKFKLKSKPYRHEMETDLDYLIVARHYGLKTRLLDWTSNYYIALYFALQGFDSSECFPISVFVVRNPKLCSYYDIRDAPWSQNEVKFFEPPHLDGRIASQQAFLSLHDNPFVAYDSENIERFNIIPSTETIKQIQNLLFTIGIRHGVIYPGLDGVCKDINDNPGLLPEALTVKYKANSFWKPVPHSWTCRPWEVTRQMFLVERRLDEFLNFKRDATVVGIEIEEGNQIIGTLFSYIEGVQLQIFHSESQSIETRELSKGEADLLKVTSSLSQQYFPSSDATFRTKRPPSDVTNIMKTRSSLFGSEVWTGGNSIA